MSDTSISAGDVDNDTVADADYEVRLSVVVPTYNERASIAGTLNAIYGASPVPTGQLEVIVADESDDETPAIVRELDHDNLRLLQFEEPKGLAGSVVEGFEAARGRYLGVTDADGQHPPAKLFELFERAEGGDNDVVVASRYVEDGDIRNWSPYRRLVSRGATALAQVAVLRGIDIADPLSGFFVVRRSLLKGLTLSPVGYKILLEIVVKAELESVTEVGYVFRDRDQGTSNLSPEEYVRYLAHLTQLVWYDIVR